MTTDQISNVIDNKIFGTNLNREYVFTYFARYYKGCYRSVDLKKVIMEKLKTNEDFTFDEWFDIFTDNVKKLNCKCYIDKAFFESEYKLFDK